MNAMKLKLHRKEYEWLRDQCSTLKSEYNKKLDVAYSIGMSITKYSILSTKISIIDTIIEYTKESSHDHSVEFKHPAMFAVLQDILNDKASQYKDIIHSMSFDKGMNDDEVEIESAKFAEMLRYINYSNNINAKINNLLFGDNN